MRRYPTVVLIALALVILGTAAEGPAQTTGSLVPDRTAPPEGLSGVPFSSGFPLIGEKRGFRPSIYVGWMEHPRGINMTDDLPNILGGVTNERPRRLSGVWLEGRFRARPTRDLLVSFTGATLIPQKTSGTIVSNIGLTAPFETDREEWVYFDVTASAPMGTSSRVLGGFRWDHTSSRLHITRPRESYDDFLVNLYFPLLGVELTHKGYFSTARFRMMGFPIVPGDITFHTWEAGRVSSSHSHQSFAKGYYMEVLTEYRQRLARFGSVGLFARWDLLHAATRTEGVLDPGHQRIRWFFDRRSWALGAAATVSFNVF